MIGHLLHASAVILSIAYLRREFPGTALWLHSFIVLGVSTMALWGARLFHVIFEVHEALTLQEFLNGRVYYGGLAGGLLGIHLVLQRFDPELRAKYWKCAGPIGAFTYAILRLNCFFMGCCYGKMTTAPWAVTYHGADSAMPYLGIPVHPVQLYDSAFGVALYFALARIKAMGFNPSYGFLLLFPLGRFVTEMFRGDAERGVDWPGGLSTSQVLSMIIFTATCFILSQHRARSYAAAR